MAFRLAARLSRESRPPPYRFNLPKEKPVKIPSMSPVKVEFPIPKIVGAMVPPTPATPSLPKEEFEEKIKSMEEEMKIIREEIKLARARIDLHSETKKFKKFTGFLTTAMAVIGWVIDNLF